MNNSVPNDWIAGKIGDAVVLAEGGVSVNSENRLKAYKEYGVLKTSSVVDGRFISCEHKTILPNEIERATVYPKKDHILFSRMNTPVLVGQSGYVDKDYEDLFLPDRLWQIKVGDKFSAKWLSYTLRSQAVVKRISDAATGTSNSMKNIAKPNLMAIPMLCPPLPEQQKIATILSSVDDVIEKTQAQIDKLKDLKTGMMQELLTKGVSDENGKRHTELKESPVGRIPVGWDVFSIGELLSSKVIGEIQDGNHGEKHPKSADFVADGIPFIMASDIHNQEVDIVGSNKISESIYSSLRIGFSKPGDVLLSHKATVGLTAIVPDNIEHLMLTPQVTYYRICDQSILYNWYLHYCFQSGYFQEKIAALSAQSTRSYIGIKAQSDLLIALPGSIEEQHKIVDVLKSVDKKTKLISSKLTVLQNTKKALMQDLLTGKVRVKVDL